MNPEEKVGVSVSETPQEKKSSSTKWIIIVVGAIVVLYVIQMMLSPERITERMIERMSDGEVDIDFDIDSDSDGGTIRFTGEDGEVVNINSGGNVSLPDNWPDSIPLPSGAKISYAGSVNSGPDDNGAMIVFSVQDNSVDMKNYFTRILSEQGWKIESTIASGDGVMLSARNEDNTGVAVYTATDAGGTQVTITAQIPD